MTTYVSTACLAPAEPLLDRVNAYVSAGLVSIELGANVVVTAEDLRRLPRECRYLVHNYFPPPPSPFVLNLASSDGSIRRRSLALASEALELCRALATPFYSVHAGFVSDPELTASALRFPPRSGSNESAQALDRFVEALSQLAALASASGMKLLVENNVCSEELLGHLLLQSADEFGELFARLGALGVRDVGMLLDLGHLNVSAHTLGFDRLEFIDTVSTWIGGFHIHDNDGNMDSHDPVTAASWILKVLGRPEFASMPRILECHCPDVATLRAQLRLLENGSNDH